MKIVIKLEKKERTIPFYYKIIEKLFNKFNIIEFRKKTIDDCIPKYKYSPDWAQKTINGKNSAKLLSEVYLDMPVPDEPNDYDTIKNYFQCYDHHEFTPYYETHCQDTKKQ